MTGFNNSPQTANTLQALAVRAETTANCSDPPVLPSTLTGMSMSLTGAMSESRYSTRMAGSSRVSGARPLTLNGPKRS